MILVFGFLLAVATVTAVATAVIMDMATPVVMDLATVLSAPMVMALAKGLSMFMGITVLEITIMVMDLAMADTAGTERVMDAAISIIDQPEQVLVAVRAMALARLQLKTKSIDI